VTRLSGRPGTAPADREALADQHAWDELLRALVGPGAGRSDQAELDGALAALGSDDSPPSHIPTPQDPNGREAQGVDEDAS
jgi:hypothetical protein